MKEAASRPQFNYGGLGGLNQGFNIGNLQNSQNPTSQNYTILAPPKNTYTFSGATLVNDYK